MKTLNLVFLFLALVFLPVQAKSYEAQISFVAPGTLIPVTLTQALSSEFTRVGETFSATLSSPVYAGSTLVAPAGSQIQGQIVAAEPAGRAGKPGLLDMRLTNIITPDGHRIPMSASVDQSFQLEADAGRVEHFAKAGLVGAGGGALSGLVGAAISGGAKGKATAIGTGIGAGVGLGLGAIQKGKEYVIPSGTSIPFKLDQAIQAGYDASPSPQYQAPSGFQAPPSGFNPYL